MTAGQMRPSDMTRKTVEFALVEAVTPLKVKAERTQKEIGRFRQLFLREFSMKMWLKDQDCKFREALPPYL